MDPQRAVEFARSSHRAVLATRRADGRPQLSPVTVTADDAGRLLVSTRQTAVKARNLARDPRVWLCLLNDQFFGDWLQAEGTAEIIRLPEAMDLLIGYYRSVSGEHPDWDDYRAAMNRERRVIVAITVTAAGPDISG